MIGLPYRQEIMIVGRTMWTQSTSVTDGQTDRQTDRRTELRSQRPCNAVRRTVKTNTKKKRTSQITNTHVHSAGGKVN